MTSRLEIRDLHVSVEGKEIVKGAALTLETGKVHALMGPNGSGKSSLAHAVMGHPRYSITSGSILLDGKDITRLPADQRAKRGLFLSFQYPAEISGVTLTNFLRSALNAVSGKTWSVVGFHQLLKEKMKELGMDSALSRRAVNEGFSGGEKKRAEILQMSILQPRFAILDETDSGLDVGALKMVAEGINRMRNPSRSMLLITHYNRLLEYIVPDEVLVMHDGSIVKKGGKGLAAHIEKEGYGFLLQKEVCHDGQK